MCAGDELFASSPLSLFGSIGAVSFLPNIKDLTSKYGIERRHYSTSDMDFFSIYDPLGDYTAAKAKKVSTTLKEVNEEFRRVVLANRKGKITVPDDKVNDVVFNGDVFHTEKAIEYGLVDGHGRCNDVIKERFPKARVFTLDSEVYGLRKVYQTLKEKLSN
jgi:ClpP class serine protease